MQISNLKMFMSDLYSKSYTLVCEYEWLVFSFSFQLLVDWKKIVFDRRRVNKLLK